MSVLSKLTMLGIGVCFSVGHGVGAAEAARQPLPAPAPVAETPALASATATETAFLNTLDRIWALARAGQRDPALALLTQTREQATTPAQIARLDALQTLLTSVDEVKPTPLDLDSAVDQAWALARAGKLDEALAVIAAARRQGGTAEQAMKLSAVETVLTTMKDAAASTASEPAALSAAAATAEAGGNPVVADRHDLWSDPHFREQFVGTYAMTAAVEPKTTEDERRVLSTVLDLMSKDSAPAALTLIEKLFQDEPPALEELGITTIAMEKWEADEAAAREAAAAASLAQAAAKGNPSGKDAASGHQDGPAKATAPKPSLYTALRGLAGSPATAESGAGKESGAPASPSAAALPADGAPAVPAPPPSPSTILRNPSAAFALIAGNICFQKGENEAAEKWYTGAVQSFPSFLRAYKNLGLLQVRMGNTGPAIEALTRALELGANDGLLYGLLGYAYAATGDHLAAEVGYRTAILRQPGNADWKLGLTRALLGQGRFAEAVTLCGRLIADKPREAALWRLQAKAYQALQQPLQAAENYEYLRLLGSVGIDDLNTLGDIYVKAELPDNAADAYLAALAAKADQAPEDYIQKAKLMANGTAPAAAKKLLVAIEEKAAGRLTDSQRKELLRVRAWIASREGVDQEQAALLEEIVRLDPLDGDALIALGQYQARTGNPEKAVFYYERAAGIERVEAKAKLRYAQLLVQQSKYEEALPLLKRALQVEPRDDVAAYLKQVESAARSRR
jgi:tetratricopeptide (TPR) repeat protein